MERAQDPTAHATPSQVGRAPADPTTGDQTSGPSSSTPALPGVLGALLGQIDPAAGARLLGSLQATAGNHAVQREADGARAAQREISTAPTVQRNRTLAQAVGFDTNLGSAQRYARALHPIAASLITLMAELARARFIDNNETRTRTLANSALRLLESMSSTLRGVGGEAANQFMWQAESMTYDMMLGEIRTTVRMMRLGAYSQGRERHWQRYLMMLNRQLLQNLAPSSQRGGAVRLPGGKVSRKLPLGVYYVPGFIVTAYLNLEVERPAPAGAGRTQATGSASVNEEGEAEPGVSTTTTGPGGARLTGGISRGSEGLTPSVGVGGPSPTRAGTASGEVTATTSGVTASHEARLSDDVSVRTNVTNAGITWSVSRTGGSGLSLAGRVDSATLAAQAPEISIAGATVRGEVSLEFRPVPAFFLRTYTQTPEMIRAFQRTLLAYGVIYLAPIAIAGGVAAGAAALPTITVAATEFGFTAAAGGGLVLAGAR